MVLFDNKFKNCREVSVTETIQITGRLFRLSHFDIMNMIIDMFDMGISSTKFRIIVFISELVQNIPCHL